MSHEILMWMIFSAVVLFLLVLDLGVFNRKAHTVKMKEALMWSAAWICVSLLFNLVIYLDMGRQPALEFLTGYLLEKSLSMDNIFVFLMIFTYFKVDLKYQHKVLFWGIIGALVMRAVFIAAGVTLINKFHWVIYLLGGILLVTAFKMAFQKEKEIHPERNPVLRIFRALVPVTKEYQGGSFFKRIDHKTFATPLFVVLIVIETTDVIFAVDSVPAILAITRDPFIVYTSNVFAILGLRALYFALSGMMEIFHHLNYGLAFILAFVGVKMMISGYYKIPLWIALVTIGATIALSIVASVIWPQKKEVIDAKQGM